MNTIPFPRPGWTPLNPVVVLSGLSRDLWSKFIPFTPNLKPKDVQASKQENALDVAKAKMLSVGITALSKVGDLQITENILIQRAGLVSNRKFIEDSGLPLTTGNSLPYNMLMGTILDWSQSDSVILADELDLTNKTITIDRDHVSSLYIVANKIKAMTGAKITYRALENPNHGNKGTNGKPGPSFDRYNSHSNQSKAPSGGDGGNGEPGRSGPQGKDAPDLNIYVLEMDGMPDLILPGQKGGQGGCGGNGGNGGHGERGRNSKKKKYAGIGVDCKHGPGWGGDGGDGGNGGKGGKGGTGGEGANIQIATLEENLESMIAGRAFEVNISGGAGGNPGIQGNGGLAGKGGKYGENTAGWPCEDEHDRWGKDGQNGQKTGDLGPGDTGSVGSLNFVVITREEWEEKLESPWIENLDPNVGFPNKTININGQNFVDGSKVHYFIAGLESAGSKLKTIYKSGKALEFIIPIDSTHGEHQVKVVTPDGDASNPVPVHVSPIIGKIEVNGEPVKAVSPGDTISIHGKAISPECSIVCRDEWFSPDNVIGETIAKLTLPTKEGEDVGGTTHIKVLNEDGYESNEIEILVLPTLDSGFRANPNGWAFDNFSKGNPSWDRFRATFEDPDEFFNEVDVSSPVLNFAFYHLLFKPYLNGDLGGAYCSALSETALKRYHEGRDDVFFEYAKTSNDPPPIDSGLMRELVIAQGKFLSKELILHYYDQGLSELGQILKSVRAIESDIRDGRGVDTARTVSFIPSGDIFDSGYFDRMKGSHTVVPMRLIYPDERRSLDGAKIYVYDSNHPDDNNRFIRLYKKGVDIHFRYPDIDSEFCSEEGLTLGNATLNLTMLQDVDLPYSLGFILDILTCPAWLRLEDDNENFIGYKDGKIYGNSELGFVSPFIKNYILTKSNTDKAFKRQIKGISEGKYNFGAFHPARKSVTLEDIDVNSRTSDTIQLDHEFSQISIGTQDVEKKFKVNLGEVTDEGFKIATAIFGAKKDEVLSVEIRPQMAAVLFKSPNREIDIDLELKSIAGANVASAAQRVKLNANENLELSVDDWKNLIGSLKLNKINKP